ncbi:PEP-CTERM sorting domain-containing protein [Photobacterium ganghwense]|uniref:PEP-CTERM sorting domain-containing protein n=1 Tax=Photobacterium ganghwense TaxID=320778 RepID=UPI004056C7FD
MKVKVKALAAALGLFFVNSASADMLTITSWLDTDAPTAGYTYTVDDNTAGRFTFHVSVPQADADILGIAFNIDGGPYNAGNIDVQNFVALNRDGGTSTAPTGLFFNDPNCGSGCNFNGVPGGINPFDVIVRVGSNGAGNSNWYYDVTFDIANLGLTLSDFESAGIRGQSVLGGNSDKAYQTFGDVCEGQCSPPQVPEPSSVAFLGLGLAGSTWLARRRKKAQSK